MQAKVIELYYTCSTKYLKLGDYIKYFDENKSIDDMLNCIKNKETPVRIRTSKENIIRHKLSDNSKVIYSYEEIEEEKIFNCELIQDDEEAAVAYGLYDVIGEKWQNKLGKQVYFCRNRELQLHLVREKDICTFLYADMQDLIQGLQRTGEIPDMLVAKMFVDDFELSKYDERGMLKD